MYILWTLLKDCYTSLKSEKRKLHVFPFIDDASKLDDVTYADIDLKKPKKPNRKQGGSELFQFVLFVFFMQNVFAFDKTLWIICRLFILKHSI